MPYGPGVYDAECTAVRVATDADVAMVIVLDGSRGSGFSVQTMNPLGTETLIKILRDTANQIEEMTQAEIRR